MQGEHAVNVEGSVVELMPDHRCRVRMPNGHHIVARLSSRLRLTFVRVNAGDRVKVTVSPFDLSKGTIVEHIAS